jgi:dienelactone hydrolase
VTAIRSAAAVLVLIVAGCQASPSATSPLPIAVPPATAAPTTADAHATASAQPPITLDPALMEARYRDALPLFDYDAEAPLDLTTTNVDVDGDISTESIEFASSTGETVSGVLASPKEHNGLPGIVWLGPSMAVVDRAQAAARLGAIVISIDPPQARRQGELALTFTEQDRDDLIELMIELRRAVDVLLVTGADPNRIGFVGYSWGAAMGGTLSGIEHRITSYVLMFADGGLVEHALETPDPSFREALSGGARDRWIAALEPLEGLYFAPHAAPSAFLFQSGLHDEEVAAVSARRLQDVASEPKESRWYDSGHDPTPDAPEVWCDQARWLQQQLRLASSSVDECRATG